MRIDTPTLRDLSILLLMDLLPDIRAHPHLNIAENLCVDTAAYFFISAVSSF